MVYQRRYAPSHQISSFPLSNLNNLLLEQVVAKLEHRSFIGFQQTCKWMYVFVRSCRHISFNVRRHESIYLKYENGLNWKCRYIKWNRDSASYIFKECFIDPDTLYATRLKRINIDEYTMIKFEDFYELAAKYRISCEELDMDSVSEYINRRVWDKDQCEALFKLIKPDKIKLDSRKSNRYEALFQLKNTENVYLYVNPEEMSNALTHLLPIFRKIDVSTGFNTGPNPYDLIQDALQAIRTQSYPQLLALRFSILCDHRPGMPTVDILKEELGDLNWKVIDKEPGTPALCGTVQPQRYEPPIPPFKSLYTILQDILNSKFKRCL